MRKIKLTAIFLMLSIGAFAQSIDDIGKIALSVVMPSNTDNISSREFSKLKSKIQQLTAKNGISGNGYNSNFVIYPKFEIFEEETLDAGLTSKVLIMGELSLYVSQTENNLIFNTISIPVKGIGNTKDKAILSAISRINTRDTELNAFFLESKSKIINYYENNCDLIASKANAFIKKQQYQEAIGLLMTVPEEVSSCYQAVQDITVKAYIAYQNNRCSTAILKAKSKIAIKDIKTALDYLSGIDPDSKCFIQSDRLITEIETEITRLDEREYSNERARLQQEIKEERLRRETKNKLELVRINAIKEIAISYYRNKGMQTTNYNNYNRDYNYDRDERIE
ncbi:MAG: hypothetical protein JKY08_09120 [Flavobacteriaceae bacterium]|nr:hypothetical protein [Flavobacteriaceae bacterium]